VAEAFDFLTGLLLRLQVTDALAKRSGTPPVPPTPSARQHERLVKTLRRIDSFRRSVAARLLGTHVNAGL
jgi:hypothetical protein